MKNCEVTRNPVPIGCEKNGCSGTMWRAAISRLEEGLGHEGYECDQCGRKIKYVPKENT